MPTGIRRRRIATTNRRYKRRTTTKRTGMYVQIDRMVNGKLVRGPCVWKDNPSLRQLKNRRF